MLCKPRIVVCATKDHGNAEPQKGNAEPRLNTLCCPSELNWVNRKDAKGAKGFIYFLIGTDDQKKNHAMLEDITFCYFNI